VILLARETLPPISLSPALLRWSSARTPFPFLAPLAPALGEMADSRVSSGPKSEVLYAPCQLQRSPPYFFFLLESVWTTTSNQPALASWESVWTAGRLPIARSIYM
jgi:hypothetical protein